MGVILYDTIQNNPGLIYAIIGRQEPADAKGANLVDYATNTVAKAQFDSQGYGARWQFWLNSPYSMNALAIAEHNIPLGSMIRLRNIDDNANIEHLGTVDQPGPLLYRFSQTHSLDEFTLRFDYPDVPNPEGANVVVSIASLFIGRALDLPNPQTAPFTPPPLGRKTEQYPQVGNKGGHFLGSHVKRVGWEFTLDQRMIDPAWVQSNWLEFARHAEHLPFFYQWDATIPGDTIYAWADQISPPRYTNPVHMAFSMRCQGRHVQ